jgi:predicted DNA-binding transcriptional regulator YafY
MGKAFGLFRGAKEYAVKIRFDYPASRWVKERCWIDNQQIEEVENKAIIYTCNVEGLETIERWVLGYGDMAQVVEPAELRVRIRETLGRMMAKY